MIKHTEQQTIFPNPVHFALIVFPLVAFWAVKGNAYFGIGLSIYLIPVIVLLWVLTLFQLSIRIDETGIGHKTFALKTDFVHTNWADIAAYELRKIKRFEFGGFGFRRAKDGWAYIFNQNAVLKITKTNGRVFYMSIENEQAVADLLAQFLSKK